MEDSQQNSNAQAPAGSLSTSSVIPGARYADPRQSDLELFYALLPGVLGACAAKCADSRSANSTALVAVREMVGQLVAMGIARPTTTLLDGSALGIMSPGIHPMAPPSNQVTTAGQGGMVGQYPNMPGQGMAATGSVQQQAGYAGAGAYAPPPSGGFPQPSANGTRGVMVGQYPNGTAPPQL